MKTTKVFKCGHSPTAKLSKNFNKADNRKQVLGEIPRNLSHVFELLGNFPDDFFSEGRKDLPSQARDFE